MFLASIYLFPVSLGFDVQFYSLPLEFIVVTLKRVEGSGARTCNLDLNPLLREGVLGLGRSGDGVCGS